VRAHRLCTATGTAIGTTSDTQPTREQRPDPPRCAQLYADPPDDFLDCLTYELLADPVCLPSSRQHVERAVILRSLLDDGRDPLSRAPLAVADLLEAPELRRRIEAWKAERRAAAEA
jgi:U-box domain